MKPWPQPLPTPQPVVIAANTGRLTMAEMVVKFDAEQTRRIVAERVAEIELDAEKISTVAYAAGFAEAIALLRDKSDAGGEDWPDFCADYLAAHQPTTDGAP